MRFALGRASLRKLIRWHGMTARSSDSAIPVAVTSSNAPYATSKRRRRHGSSNRNSTNSLRLGGASRKSMIINVRSFLSFVFVLGTAVCNGSQIGSEGVVAEPTAKPTSQIVLVSEVERQQLNPRRGDPSPKAGRELSQAPTASSIANDRMLGARQTSWQFSSSMPLHSRPCGRPS